MGAFVPPPGQPKPLQDGEFKSASAPSQVHFDLQHLTSPSALYVRPEEALEVTVVPFVAASAVLRWRFLLTNGQLQIGSLDLNGLVANVNNSFVVPLPEGYLLSIRLDENSGPIPRGAAWCTAAIVRGAGISAPGQQQLIANYVCSESAPSWPNGSLIAPGDGAGFINTVLQAGPGGGVDVVITVPARTRHRVLGLTANFTTSATVATRIPRLQIKEATGKLVWQSAPTQSVPASQAVTVSAGSGQSTSTVDTLTVNVPLPSFALLSSGYTIGFNTLNLQAGDSWTNTTMSVETWSGVR